LILESWPYKNSNQSIDCHGDRIVPARFGPVGGLSQPRRDTVDPKNIRPRAIYPIRKIKSTFFYKKI
jgi:hypothetical protein